MNVIVVRFLLEDGSVQRGELISPYQVDAYGAIWCEFENDDDIDVLVADYDTWYVFRVSLSKVASLNAAAVYV